MNQVSRRTRKYILCDAMKYCETSYGLHTKERSETSRFGLTEFAHVK